MVIAKASGISYEEYAIEKIIKPLGLKNTYPDYKKNISNIATGYSAVVPDEERFAFDHYATYAYAPATGFVSNALDLVTFISSFSMNEGSKNILSRESIKEMSRSHAKTEENDEYGLGLEIFNLNGKKIIGHGGGFNGYITKTLFDTQNDISVIVLTNSLSSSAGRLAAGILDSIHKLISSSQDYKSSSKINFSKYEGVYRSVWGDSVISKVGNILISYDPETNNPLKVPTRLIPTSALNTFTMKSKAVFSSYDEEAVFSDFKNGKAQKVTEASMPMKRIG